MRGRARTSRSTSWPRAIEPDPARIVHVEHIHPQSEIAVLRCDPALASELLGWSPTVALDDGLGPGPHVDGGPDGAGHRGALMAVGATRLAIDGGDAGPDDAPAVCPSGHR